MATQAQLKAIKKYDKANTFGVFLKFNIKTDSDIVEHLKELGNKQGYIKQLIRDDLKRKNR